MSRPPLEEFLSNRNQVALKLSSASVGGLLKRRFVIPRSTSGLALFPDARTDFPRRCFFCFAM